jgi:hypothetical protein
VRAVFIVDTALEHTCTELRARAADGEITAAERDLLIDGAILLAVKVEELIQDAHAGQFLAPVAIPDLDGTLLRRTA